MVKWVWTWVKIFIFQKFIVTYKQCGSQNININNTAEETAFLISRGIIGVQGKMSYTGKKCFHGRRFSHWNHWNYIMLQKSYNYSAENAVQKWQSSLNTFLNYQWEIAISMFWPAIHIKDNMQSTIKIIHVMQPCRDLLYKANQSIPTPFSLQSI